MSQEARLDYQAVASTVGKFPLIGLGESTHGTHEFFVTKAEVFKLLVKDHGFNTLFFETIDDHCEAINKHFQNGEGNLKSLVNKLFYVWRTQEVLSLFKWLNLHHKEYPVKVVGLDERKYVSDYTENYDAATYNLRDSRMAEVIERQTGAGSDIRGMIWAHDLHISADLDPSEVTPVDYRRVPMGHNLRQLYGDNYYNVAQLFGYGEFSTAVIDDKDEVDNSNLQTITVPPAPEGFAEYELGERVKKPTFLLGPTFGGLLESNQIYAQRGLGWGTQLSKIDSYGANVEFSKAYNAVIFFPQASASQPLSSY